MQKTAGYDNGRQRRLTLSGRCGLPKTVCFLLIFPHFLSLFLVVMLWVWDSSPEERLQVSKSIIYRLNLQRTTRVAKPKSVVDAKQGWLTKPPQLNSGSCRLGLDLVSGWSWSECVAAFCSNLRSPVCGWPQHRSSNLSAYFNGQMIRLGNGLALMLKNLKERNSFLYVSLDARVVN